ncbi:TetR/AcrR family transcriptional regulator [Prescottella soli]|uniref:AcrR family transcriptional regulator n=2 Tax=Prescottella TaxID=2979332 RepID=A0ABT6M8V7_9NOCA|nr:TetR/AcrR family transcriptional regulator [Prescottella agglutinans]MDH6280743.1 AcrR family transcriptional regulator [Prescottella agglutinans]MDH6676569.1 AcrR family transcriptional regulator [Rhodococcus sp. LBL1]MDH6681855.1 AcrR family transcriptional regulator [Rhodococcus sp. LBL2]
MDPQERRRQILDRSGEIFATKGISATTVREIADACGVYSGTLYHYFPSKDAIVTEIIRVYVDELYERCTEVIDRQLPPIERLEALVLVAIDAAENHRHATAIWQVETDYMRDKMLEASLGDKGDFAAGLWMQCLTEAQADGELRSDIDAATFYQLMRDSVWLTSRWFRASPKKSNADFAHEITSIYIDGLRVR